MTSYDVSFEEDVLAQSLKDKDYVRQASSVLKDYHFATKKHGWIWQCIMDSWKDRELASIKLLASRAKREYKKEEDINTQLKLILKLKKRRPKSPKGALYELRQFVRFVGIQEAMERSAKALKDGDVDGAYDHVGKVYKGDTGVEEYEIIDWASNFEARQAERKHKKEHPELYSCVPTGIKRLDRIITGIQGGELGLVVATTGRGKSVFLTQLAHYAATHNFTALYVPLEMPERQIAQRQDSRFTRMMYDKFKLYEFTESELKEVHSLMERNKKRLANKLCIASIKRLRQCNINMIRQMVQEMEDNDNKPDVILLDSADHMKPVYQFGDKRIDQAEIYWDIKTLAVEENIGIWSSTHAGRGWVDKIAGAESVAEAYDKARIADTVLTLNQPKKADRSTAIMDDDEEEPKPPPEPTGVGTAIELFLAKYRDGESKITIPLDADFSMMLMKERLT